MLKAKIKLVPVSVVYTGGYANDEVPEGLNRASLLQTVYEFQGRDHLGAESVSSDGGVVQRPELGLLKIVKGLLDNYKHPTKMT